MTLYHDHTHTHTPPPPPPFPPELELTNVSSEVRSRVMTHCVQLLPGRAFRERECSDMQALDPGARGELVIPVTVSLPRDDLV